jgi:hypothetical protein
MHGLHDTVSVNGGTEMIIDTPKGTDKLKLQIGAQGSAVAITNFGVANAAVSLVQALASAEHWTSPAQIAAAVTSDNNGGSLLNLGSHGSIDFVNTTHLTYCGTKGGVRPSPKLSRLIRSRDSLRGTGHDRCLAEP